MMVCYVLVTSDFFDWQTVTNFFLSEELKKIKCYSVYVFEIPLIYYKAYSQIEYEWVIWVAQHVTSLAFNRSLSTAQLLTAS